VFFKKIASHNPLKPTHYARAKGIPMEQWGRKTLHRHCEARMK